SVPLSASAQSRLLSGVASRNLRHYANRAPSQDHRSDLRRVERTLSHNDRAQHRVVRFRGTENLD
ncbi:MAG: hypothetical protein ACK55I_10480, partial [bacterium]